MLTMHFYLSTAVASVHWKRYPICEPGRNKTQSVFLGTRMQVRSLPDCLHHHLLAPSIHALLRPMCCPTNGLSYPLHSTLSAFHQVKRLMQESGFGVQSTLAKFHCQRMQPKNECHF